jgi:predicted anti-sigma-YlaC factor YlaD
MSGFTCADMREVAPELALGVLGGAERAEAFAHVESCGSCRAVVSDLTDAAETLPLIAREAEPPPGFEGRVVAALGGRRRRIRFRWAAVLAATAAAAAIISIVTVRVVDRGRDDGPAASVAASGVWSAPMIDAQGTDVGWAFVSDGRPAAVGISVSYALPSGTYTIESVRGDGATLDVGTLTVSDGQGAWAGTVPTAKGDLIVVRLLDAGGNVVCTANPSV